MVLQKLLQETGNFYKKKKKLTISMLALKNVSE